MNASHVDLGVVGFAPAPHRQNRLESVGEGAPIAAIFEKIQPRFRRKMGDLRATTHFPLDGREQMENKSALPQPSHPAVIHRLIHKPGAQQDHGYKFVIFGAGKKGSKTMLSLLPNLIFAASGLLALGTLVLSWWRYRADWAALHAGLAAGMPAGTVHVTIRDTTIHAAPRDCAPAAVVYHPGFGEKAAALPFQPGAIPARRPVLRAAA